MEKVVAKNKKEVEKYRQRLFKAKEVYRKEQAKLPFEKKIEIVMKLNRFAREWRPERERSKTSTRLQKTN